MFLKSYTSATQTDDSWDTTEQKDVEMEDVEDMEEEYWEDEYEIPTSEGEDNDEEDPTWTPETERAYKEFGDDVETDTRPRYYPNALGNYFIMCTPIILYTHPITLLY